MDRDTLFDYLREADRRNRSTSYEVAPNWDPYFVYGTNDRRVTQQEHDENLVYAYEMRSWGLPGGRESFQFEPRRMPTLRVVRGQMHGIGLETHNATEDLHVEIERIYTCIAIIEMKATSTGSSFDDEMNAIVHLQQVFEDYRYHATVPDGEDLEEVIFVHPQLSWETAHWLRGFCLMVFGSDFRSLTMKTFLESTGQHQAVLDLGPMCYNNVHFSCVRLLILQVLEYEYRHSRIRASQWKIALERVKHGAWQVGKWLGRSPRDIIRNVIAVRIIHQETIRFLAPFVRNTTLR
ncbi:hypothetical protein G7046_g7093 [Stylonectria norvegica]|nr:hypothetical protein G7046_g7093 [Stylonectria norvegica]